MTDTVREVVLARPALSMPRADDFTVVTRKVAPPGGDGWLKVRPLYLSIDP